ncbi:MAG: CorA family divalent cation transporter [Erysipelotrichaceae bacterium]
MQQVLLFSKINTITDFLEPNVIDYINTKQTFAFESFENSNIFAFEWHNINIYATKAEKVLVYMDNEDLFIFCENEGCLKNLAVLLPEGFSNEKALYQFFVNLFHDDLRFLENFESKITDIEDSALKNSKHNYLNKIMFYRKELLSLKRYYEQLDIILDNLCANDNNILSAEGERFMAIISGRVHRYHSYVLNLRDYVTQMREAYQAQIDIEQNQFMKVFTVVTAIFLPLTLIAGWYGMNFKYMPELYWEYGYLLVIILSISVCVGMLWYFKKKKWF